MKKLTTLLIIIFSVGSLKAQDTSSTVCVPYNVAKKVAKDLMEGDSAKAILANTYQELDLMNQQVGYKDSIILNQRIKEVNYLSQLKNKDVIIENKDKQFGDLSADYKKLAKKYKWTKTKGIISNIALIVLAGTAAYFHFIVPK